MSRSCKPTFWQASKTSLWTMPDLLSQSTSDSPQGTWRRNQPQKLSSRLRSSSWCTSSSASSCSVSDCVWTVLRVTTSVACDTLTISTKTCGSRTGIWVVTATRILERTQNARPTGRAFGNRAWGRWRSCRVRYSRLMKLDYGQCSVPVCCSMGGDGSVMRLSHAELHRCKHLLVIYSIRWI
jgi:hypothetical protein